MAKPRTPSPPAKAAGTPPSAPSAASIDQEEARVRALALLDPLLLAARRFQKQGDAPAATYDLACDAWDQANPDSASAYDPSPEVYRYLHLHWSELLLEGEEERMKAGRPSLLTPALLERIAAAADAGLKDPQIYQKLGVRQRTWSGWLADPEGELARTLERARAEMAERLLRDVAGMPKGWQAGVWLLTQHYPELFSRPNADTTVNVSATASASATATTKVSKEDLAARQARTKKKLKHQVDRLQLDGTVDGNN